MAARGRSERSRSERRRQEKPYFIIVCEGKTEYLYFRDIKRRFRANWIDVCDPHCNDPLNLVRVARSERIEHERKGLEVEAWAVFDAESREKQEDRGYSEAMIAAEKGKVRVANSSPSFEYWILLHYAPGILVDAPREAERELARPGRIAGYRKPNLPCDELWDAYLGGGPSEAARARRAAMADDGVDPRMGRPVTYADELVDRIASTGGVELARPTPSHA